MADVFISYSRKNSVFARRLIDRLVLAGKDSWVDWEGIPLTSPNWWAEIKAGVEGADSFLFIMSPDSMASVVCNMELDYAIEQRKRIVPVVYQEVESREAFASIADFMPDEAMEERLAGKDPLLIARDNWQRLSHINWVFLRDEDDFDEAFDRLITTVETDLEYVKAHTRYLTRAIEWQRENRRQDLLLRGDDLKQAENWLAVGVNNESAPTQLHAEYINASRIAERTRQRRLFTGVALALVVSIGLALLSFGLFQQSEARRFESEQRGTAVAQQAAAATFALGAAETNLRQAREIQSRLLADFSRQELTAGNIQTALLLALEALRYADDDIVNLENTSALRNVLAYPGEALYMSHDDSVQNAAWNDDASQIMSFSRDGTARLWDAHNGDLLWVLNHGDTVFAGAWHTNGSQVLTASADGTARTWDVGSGENLLMLEHDGIVLGAIWFDDHSRILTVGQTLESMAGSEERYQGTVHIWDADSGHELRTLAHPEIVRFAFVNADGTRILTSCDDGFTRIWDAQSGEVLVSLQHEFAVWRAIYNEDESRILTMDQELTADGTVGEGNSVRIWDAVTGEELVTLPYAGGVASFPQWNSDGTRVLTTSSDPDGQWGMVQVWDARSGAELLALRHVADRDDLIAPQPQAVWNADETRILSWAGKAIRVWDAASGDVLRTMPHEAVVHGAIWSEDETRILGWDNDGVIQVWDVGVQDVLTTLRHDAVVWGAQWSNDETAILSWSSDGTARLWNASNPTELLQISYETPFGAAAWHPDGKQVASWSGPTAAVWDPEAGERLFAIEHAGETVHGMTWNREGSRILSWGRDGTARLWDPQDGSEILSLRHNDVVLDAQWSHSEHRILTRTLEGMLYVWDLNTMTEVFPAVQYRLSGAGGAAWSPDDRHILTWSSDESRLRLWDADSGDEIHSIPSEPGFIGAVWNPEGTRILYWNDNETAHIWDVAAGAEDLTLLQVADRIRGGAWSADGSRILTWTVRGDIRIWDAADGTELIAIENCGGHVHWSADENRLLCGMDLSANDGVRVWDIAQGEMVLEYPLDVEGQIDGVAWNADERRILLWKILPGATYVWNADITEWIEIGRTRTYRELSAEERVRYFLPPLP